MRKRKNSNRTFKHTYAVVVDGETEGFYLQMLKRHEGSNRRANVKIDPQIPQKTSLEVQYNKVLTLAEEYTFVYWIVDLDTILKETREAKKGNVKPIDTFTDYHKTLEKKTNNVIIVVNNPCLEYWFLLHFENTCKRFENCAAAEKELKKHIKDYTKNKKYFTRPNNDIYLKLKPHQETAIKNAQAIGDFCYNNPEATLCEMPKLILKLRELLN